MTGKNLRALEVCAEFSRVWFCSVDESSMLIAKKKKNYQHRLKNAIIFCRKYSGK